MYRTLPRIFPRIPLTVPLLAALLLLPSLALATGPFGPAQQPLEVEAGAGVFTSEDLLREDLIQQILEARQAVHGRTFASQALNRIRRGLVDLPTEHLRTLADGGGELTSISAPALGDSTQDLVFTPLATACRVYDSRGTTDGAFVANETRNIFVAGTLNGGGSQGGAANCGIPLGSAVAVVANVLAVDPQGKGNYQAWPFGGSPGDSVINFGGPPNFNINLINGVMIPICNPNLGPCLIDLSVRLNFASSSDFLLAVTGYFSAPERTQLDCMTVTNTFPVPPGDSFSRLASCPAGYRMSGGGYNYTSNTNNVEIWQVSPAGTSNVDWRCRGFNPGANPLTENFNCIARCCRVPGI